MLSLIGLPLRFLGLRAAKRPRVIAATPKTITGELANKPIARSILFVKIIKSLDSGVVAIVPFNTNFVSILENFKIKWITIITNSTFPIEKPA